MIKPCECELAGYCARHNMEKNANLVRLCQTKEKFRKFWDGEATQNKVAKYLSARRKWIKAGRPVRTKEERERVFAICEACPFYVVKKTGKGACNKCGCGISKAKALFNKLEWKTETCPANKW